MLFFLFVFFVFAFWLNSMNETKTIKELNLNWNIFVHFHNMFSLHPMINLPMSWVTRITHSACCCSATQSFFYPLQHASQEVWPPLRQVIAKSYSHQASARPGGKCRFQGERWDLCAVFLMWTIKSQESHNV